MRVLLVEDDKNLGKATAEGLRDSYATDWVQSAEEAEDALATTAYALIVLDINLPGASGLELLDQLTQRQKPDSGFTANGPRCHSSPRGRV
jgi:DNA-binding response OmpR family regulator